MCEKCRAAEEKASKAVSDAVSVMEKEAEEAVKNADARFESFGQWNSTKAHLARIAEAKKLLDEWVTTHYPTEGVSDDISSKEFKDVAVAALKNRMSELSLEEIAYQCRVIGYWSHGISLLERALTSEVAKRIGTSISLALNAQDTPAEMVA